MKWGDMGILKDRPCLIIARMKVLVVSKIIRSPRSLFTQKICSTTTSWRPDYFDFYAGRRDSNLVRGHEDLVNGCFVTTINCPKRDEVVPFGRLLG